MAVMQVVKLTTPLAQAEVHALMQRRAPEYREVLGLIQKYYGSGSAANEFFGVYIFDSQDALEAFRASELARSISSAFRAHSTRVEDFDLLFSLHQDSAELGLSAFSV
ncbi:MAG: hypothetical protein V7607_2639 [Solirubrobacteraceae bacterium]